MGRSQETFGKKEVRNKKEKKRKEKEKKRELRKAEGKKNSFNDMIAYVDEYGRLSAVPPDPANKTLIVTEDIEISATRNKPSPVPAFLRRGIVISFNESRGFGFIKENGTNNRFFVHANNLIEPIKENDHVIFESGKGLKGPSALKVKVFRE
jgi:cold shock CspA family protein